MNRQKERFVLFDKTGQKRAFTDIEKEIENIIMHMLQDHMLCIMIQKRIAHKTDLKI